MVSLAVLYNVIFVVGRAVFWEINNNLPPLWWTLDYLCDFIYIIDALVHCHEGTCCVREHILCEAYIEKLMLFRARTKCNKNFKNLLNLLYARVATPMYMNI